MKHNFFVFISLSSGTNGRACRDVRLVFAARPVGAANANRPAARGCRSFSDDPIGHSAQQMLAEGRQIFRYQHVPGKLYASHFFNNKDLHRNHKEGKTHMNVTVTLRRFRMSLAAVCAIFATGGPALPYARWLDYECQCSVLLPRELQYTDCWNRYPQRQRRRRLASD